MGGKDGGQWSEVGGQRLAKDRWIEEYWNTGIVDWMDAPMKCVSLSLA